MLMALELSGGQNGATPSAGERPGSAGPAAAPGDNAAVPVPAAQPVVRSPQPKAPAASQTTTASAVPATKKPEPIAQTPAKPAKPVRQSEPATAQRPDPAPQIAEKESPPVTSAAPEQHLDNSGQGIAGPGQEGPGTTGVQSGAASHQPGAGSGSGSPGTGSGPAGTGGASGLSGGPGAGGSLIKFGTPGGPGIVRMAKPRYPSEAKRLGKEGIVVMKLSLDETGAVYAVEILQGAGFGMEEASREAVMLSRFRPATAKGRPVPCQAILPIHFKLR